MVYVPTLPPEESVVADERSNLARADSETNSTVDHIGEESDTVLKVIPRNLHHPGGVLNNGHLGGKEHLSSTIKKAIDRLMTL
jgi:hypothetical protein